MTPLIVLQQARSLLARGPQTWVQGMYVSGLNNAFCTVGAVREPLGINSCNGEVRVSKEGLETFHASLDYIRDAMASVHGHIEGITTWNDRPDRTYAEVMAVFDRAVLLAAKDEGLHEFAPIDTVEPSAPLSDLNSLIEAASKELVPA